MGQESGQPPAADAWFMPDEAAPHRRTWMAFGARREIWDDLLPDAQAAVALLARTISEFEPVTMLVRPEERQLAARLCGDRVELVAAPLDDLWIRDTGPVFVVNRAGKLGAVDFNFNGWGRKQSFRNDAKVARFVAGRASAAYLKSALVGEGGGIEVDGGGTAIVTESCFVNRNRNPNLDKADCERELRKMLGLRAVVWLPGVRGKDITDGHTDFYARFAGRGVVLAGLESDEKSFDYAVTREHLRILRSARDADGRPLEVATIASPQRVRRKWATKEFAAGYINYYLVNGAALAPEFGDKEADARCRTALAARFPQRKVVLVNIDALAAGGGGIHCATLQEPLPDAALHAAPAGRGK